MNHDDPDTFTPTASDYVQPTAQMYPDLFAYLHALQDAKGQIATDNEHALCFNCKFNTVRVMTACYYSETKKDAGDGECIWSKVK